MGELQGTSTIVTDVQTQQNNGAETSNQNNNYLTQGNAAEQTIKLTVENANPNSSFAENFINQIDAKMTNSNNISSKLANTQNQLLNKTDILTQMNTKFNEMQQAGSNKVSIVLQPESLGKVSVEIMNSKDGIIAKMTTDNQQVKELFDKNVESLKASLSSQGVNVNNIKVECSHQSENNAMDFERQQFNQNFNNQSNNQNHTNHSNSNNAVETSSYSNDYETQEEQNDEIQQTEINNTNVTIEHNGKIDYKV
jgi:flagellar hook-length control protein FliK